MALLKYFRRIDEPKDKEEDCDMKLPQLSPATKEPKKRGEYQKFSPKEKAEIGKYASEHGVTKTIKHFQKKGVEVKASSVRDWRRAYEKELKGMIAEAKPGEIVTVQSLSGKKRGRPPLIGALLDGELQARILSMRSHQAVINCHVVLGTARALLLKNNRAMLSDFGGPISLQKEWARSVLQRMGFSKRRATSTSKVKPTDLEKLKQNYLINIYSIVKMEDIHDSLIINWDQTSMKIVPTSSWTMEKKGTKRVEIAATDDKRQITGVFGCSVAGDFLPLQLVYKGTTPRCLPKNVDFPKDWDLAYSANHWSNEATMKDYVNHVILPYVSQKRKELGLSSKQAAIVIFDYFKGQCLPSIFKLLEDNDIFYVLVPANCTDRLQPLDLRVNKPAKDFMKQKFQEWYANIILKQLQDNIDEPVDMRLSIMKPMVSKWAIEMYDHFVSHPNIIINGFRAAGIYKILH